MSIRFRILTVLLLLLLIFLLPWFIVALLCLAALFKFKNFYELAGIAFVFDLTYSLPNYGLFDFQFMFTTFALLLILIVEVIKSRLIFYVA